MNYNQEIKRLILKLYPTESLHASCIKCAEDLDCSEYTLYKSCGEKYKGRKTLWLLLTFLEEKNKNRRKSHSKKIIEDYKTRFLSSLTVSQKNKIIENLNILKCNAKSLSSCIDNIENQLYKEK